MKKILVRLLIAIVILLILAALAVTFFLDGAVKRGVEKIGPQLTKVDVKLDSVKLSLWSGSGKIGGLTVGNPEGFKTPQAILVGSASLSLKPMSLLGDKVIIPHMELNSPEITFEAGLGGNNLSKILSNLEETTGGKEGTKAEEKKEGRKLQVDDFVIAGAKLRLGVTELGGQAATVPIPDIHLTNLGQGPEGITAGELAKEVLRAIEKESVKVAAERLPELIKGAGDLGKGLGGSATNVTGKIGETVGGLLKRKSTNQ